MIKVINPTVDIWSQKGYDLESIYDHIARCARVCYQSVPNRKDESSYDFLKRTILRGKDIKDITKDYFGCHLSVFEHGTVHLRIPYDVYCDKDTAKYLIKNPFTRYSFVDEANSDKYLYVTTNMRVLIENDWLEYLDYIDDDNSHSDYYSSRHTFSITTDIGCSRELNRHRSHSISEESTRYCRYTANKFGNNISITKLPWIDFQNRSIDESCYQNRFYLDSEIYDEDKHRIEEKYTNGWDAIGWFLYGIQIANLVYAKCVQHGWSAQQAREILPLNTKTQLVHTAFRDDWENFVDLRLNEVSGKVHPVMKDIASKIHDGLDIYKELDIYGK